MALIMNCLDKEQTTIVGGAHFSFGPHQIKYFSNPEIAANIAKLRKEDGFMRLPDELDHLGMLKPEQFEKVVTPEDKATITAVRQEGVENYCRRLRELIYNATVSVQKDIDMKGLKLDARTLATKKDLERFKELAKYQKSKNDLEQKQLDEIKELEKQIGPLGVRG